MHTLRHILFIILIAASGISAQSQWDNNDMTEQQELRAKQIIEEFQIYPNPTIDYINIRTEGSAASYILSNLIGKTIQQAPIIDGHSIIDLTSQHKGIYIIKIYNDENERITTRKIIKK